MYHNNVTINVHNGTAINNKDFDLLHPSAPVKPWLPAPKLWKVIATNVKSQKLLFKELSEVCKKQQLIIDASCDPVKPVDLVTAVQVHIEQLAAKDHLDQLGLEVKKSYSDMFEPIPHIDEMPNTVQCKNHAKRCIKVDHDTLLLLATEISWGIEYPDW